MKILEAILPQLQKTVAQINQDLEASDPALIDSLRIAQYGSLLDLIIQCTTKSEPRSIVIKTSPFVPHRRWLAIDEDNITLYDETTGFTVIIDKIAWTDQDVMRQIEQLIHTRLCQK